MPRNLRKAKNQALFRQVNERIADIAPPFDDDVQPFFCECDRLGCVERIELPVSEYTMVRGDPTAFLVLRGHDGSDEAVVIDRGSYLIVRSADAAAA